MANIVGLDGNNAPREIEGIDPRLWMGIQARAYTYAGREPFNPDFGLGLVDALAFPNPGQSIWRERMIRSFASLEGFTFRDGTVNVVGGRAEIQVEIE